jgi:hypothetical protein
MITAAVICLAISQVLLTLHVLRRNRKAPLTPVLVGRIVSLQISAHGSYRSATIQVETDGRDHLVTKIRKVVGS